MIRFLRYSAAALAVCLGCTAPAFATTYSTDFTDLWYNTSESGWGFNVIQQGNTLFGTLFVYGSDQSARWFVASDMQPQNATAGQFRFSGKLYQTTGPFFAAPTFNPSQVNVTEVGEATITFTTANAATLVYRVGADTVTKQVTRQTFVSNTPAGVYIGAGMTTGLSACTDTTRNGGFSHFLGNLTATKTGTNVTFRLDSIESSGQVVCSFGGAWSQEGRLANVTGTWGCVAGSATLNSGTFSLSQVDVQVNGMTGNVVAIDQFCTYTGRFGGLRGLGPQ